LHRIFAYQAHRNSRAPVQAYRAPSGKDKAMTLRMDQRAAHYQDQADKLRELADLEAVSEISAQLRELAQECQELADKLKQPVQCDDPTRGSADPNDGTGRP
jgi:hypothetical protein